MCPPYGVHELHGQGCHGLVPLLFVFPNDSCNAINLAVPVYPVYPVPSHVWPKTPENVTRKELPTPFPPILHLKCINTGLVAVEFVGYFLALCRLLITRRRACGSVAPG